jgi:hypothetical protein
MKHSATPPYDKTLLARFRDKQVTMFRMHQSPLGQDVALHRAWQGLSALLLFGPFLS